MSSYSRRRRLQRRDWKRVLGAGLATAVAAGLGAGYVAALLLQRERMGADARRGDPPILVERREPAP